MTGYPWLLAFVSVGVVSIISLVGVFAFSVREQVLRGILFILISLSVGAMFGDVFLHILPELYEENEAPLTSSLVVLTGIFLFFILEKFFRWSHEHTSPLENHNGGEPNGRPHPVGYINLVADAIHNTIDGMLIGAAYLVNMPVGLATTLAVILHEIPQEIGDFGVLLHAGFTRAKALLFNSLSAAFAIVGVAIGLFAGSALEAFAPFALALTAGGFIYIAGSDLVPELHKERAPSRSAVQLAAMIAGVIVMFLLTLVE